MIASYGPPGSGKPQLARGAFAIGARLGKFLTFCCYLNLRATGRKRDLPG
jgi:hypothetical protein